MHHTYIMSTATFVLMPGDEFAYHEFPEIAHIFYGNGVSRATLRHTAGSISSSSSDAPTTNSPISSDNIEVFEDTSRIMNVYSIPDIDRLRILTDDFGGNHVLAYQFATIIKREAHIRAQFQQHANHDIMMRQLVIIGQDPNIFSSRIIIPHVRIVGESYIDMLLRTSVTTLAHKVIRSVRRARKDVVKTTAMRMISANEQPSTSEREGPDDGAKRRVVQFPFPILAIIESAGNSAQVGSSRASMISPSMSVTIDSIDIEPLGKYPHISPFWRPQAIDPERKTSWARSDTYQWRETQPLETLPSNRAQQQQRISSYSSIMQTYDYLRALFRFLFGARPCYSIEIPLSYGASTMSNMQKQTHEFVDREESSSMTTTRDDTQLRVITLEPKYAHILDALSKLSSSAGFVINTTSMASILMEFLAHGLLRAYLQVVSSALLTTRETSSSSDDERALIEADEIAHHWVIEINARTKSRKATAQMDAEFARVRTLARIIIETIGRAKISSILTRQDGTMTNANLLSSNPLRITAQDIGANVDQSGLKQSTYLGVREGELLALLSARERSHVLARLDMLLRPPPSVKCKHIDVLRDIREAVSASSAKRALDGCAGIFDIAHVPDSGTSSSDDDSMQLIPCLICGVPVCCPHIINIARAIARHATYQEERTILSPYIMKIHDANIHYCVICGAVFDWNKINDDDRDVVHKSAIDKELTDMIFHEIALTTRMIRATNVPDQIAFHRAIVRHIYPFIEIISSRVYVTQTSATDVARAKLHIFITIYVFADCIVNMDSMGIVFEGFRLDDARTSKGREREREHDKTARVIKYVIDKIISIKNAQLNLVPNFTRDVVSENLITAVAQLRRVAHVMPQEQQQATDYRSMLYLDPVFEFLTNTGATSMIKHNPVALLPSARDLRASNGESINIYARLLAKKQTTDANDALFLGHLRIIYENRLFAYPLATTNKKILDLLTKITRENEAMRAQDKELLARISILTQIAPTKTILRDGAHALSFPFARVSLSELYDEQGRAHVWATYVIANHGNDDMQDATETYRDEPIGKHPTLAPGEYIKDRRCSICGKTMTEARQTNKDDVIWSALTKRELVDDFYKFYQVRCPEGGEHEFANVGASKEKSEGKCKKCAIPRDVSLRALNGDDRNKYFDKYVSVFREYIAQPLSDHNISFETATDDDASTGASLAHIAREFIDKPWTYNYEAVITCAESLNIASVRLQSIGAREGLTDDELMSKTYVVREPISRDDARILTLRGTIIELLNMYTILRNVPEHMKIRQRTAAQLVEDLRKSANTTTAQFDQECADLPGWDIILAQVYPSIVASATTSTFALESIISRVLTEFAFSDREPADIANYYLEMLAKLIHALTTCGNGLCALFAREFFASVDARQNMTMRNEFFNVLVLEGTKLKDARENKYVSDDIDDDAVPNTDYDIDDDERDPFSLDSFDVDDDDDESGVDMKLGRDIGW